MAFKINNPFGKKDERSFMPQSWRDERSQFNTYLNETMQDIETMADDFEERMVTQRGKDVYNEVMNIGNSSAQPVFTNSKDKKYPYLMSVYTQDPYTLMSLGLERKSDGSIAPWRCNPRSWNQNTQFCEDFYKNQDVERNSLFGTKRGLLKDMEHDAKLGNEMMEKILAMDVNEANFVNNMIKITQEYRDKFLTWDRTLDFEKMDERQGRKHVGWQLNKQLNVILNNHYKAQELQDEEDKRRITNYQFNKAFEDSMEVINEAKNNLSQWRNR
tara:strand:+ start:52 stop:867 length:816 start_codon:yes stop_codon:yes gene_type:complete